MIVGYKHTDIGLQISIMRTRIELLRYALALGAFALVCACLSMFLLFAGYSHGGDWAFGLSLISMIISLSFGFYETSLSNKSLIVEIDDILAKESKSR
jgi:uncharacterized membrane protein